MDIDREVSATFPKKPGFTIVELPAVEGISNVMARGLNSHGDVVGQVVFGRDGTSARAFFYDAATGSSRRIGDHGSDQFATAINDAGQVAINDHHSDHAYRWDAGGMIDVGAAAGNKGRVYTQLFAINSRGWLAGFSLSVSGLVHAVLWNGATLSDLTPALNAHTMATAMNSSGQAVGVWSSPGGHHAVLFENGEMRDLGTLGGDSVASGINDRGRIVGSSGAHGFVYDLPSGPMRDIAPSRYTMLSAVNTAGDAVGGMGDLFIGSALLWRDGDVIDLTDALGDPSWLLITAQAINDRGQIIGSGTHDGKKREFRLSPL
jgi:probable HAF family extracellular repeat protein